jgi:metallo-beta-lactamase class B
MPEDAPAVRTEIAMTRPRTRLCRASLPFPLVALLVGPAMPNLAPAAAEWVATCEDCDEWDRPGPPFQIHGDTYYVGTCGIAAILIAGQEGHILIDGGTEAGAEVIARNIAALGFNVADLRLLLHSHEHFDHVAGLAELQRLSGAELVASVAAAPVLATGRDAASDPQAGMHPPFPAARIGRTIEDGETLTVGDLRVTAIATPGHTAGALSWQWESCTEAGCETIVYADSLSPVSAEDYAFSDHPDYLAAYRAGLDRLAAADCTLLLTPHPSASGLRDRLTHGRLTDDDSCRAYAAGISLRLDQRLAKEAAGR